jgi:predicted subunit of tRNA(5-methylaminomethyl-2-thiouridylate) methyltransferase
MKQLQSQYTIKIETKDSAFSCALDEFDDIDDNTINDDKALIEFVQKIQSERTQHNLSWVSISPAQFEMYHICDEDGNKLFSFNFTISKKQQRSKFVDYKMRRLIGNNWQVNTWQEAAWSLEQEVKKIMEAAE